MAITQNHVINIQPGVSAPLVIHCSQGDTGTQINLTVVNGDEEFDCSSYACSVHGVRSDGGNWGPITCTVSGSTVCFSLTSAMTAVAGACLAEISVGTVGTANFAMLMENATFGNGVTYSNDVSVYQNILNAVQAGLSLAEAAVTNEKNERIAAVTNEKDERIAAVTNEKDERVNADNSLSSRISQNDARINNLIVSSGSDSSAEVIDARTGYDSTVYDTLGNAIRTQIKKAQTIYKPIILNSDGTTMLDLNDVKENRTFRIQVTKNTTCLNLPSDFPYDGRIWILSVYENIFWNHLYYLQILFPVETMSRIYYRQMDTRDNIWRDWGKISIDDDIKSIDDDIKSIDDDIKSIKNELNAIKKMIGYNKEYNGDYNYLAIGNSITLHPIVSYWWTECGMAATRKENDYYHKVCDYLTSKKGTLGTYVVNYSDWETQYYDRAETYTIIDRYLSDKLNLVTIQLSENANNTSTLESDYVSLINYIKRKAPNAEIILIGDFWDKDKTAIKARVAESTGAKLASLDDIVGDSSYKCGLNTTVYSDDGVAHTVTHDGVANHPGDRGMEYIANKVISLIS